MFRDNIIYKIKVSMTKTRWKIINLDVVQRDENNEKKRNFIRLDAGLCCNNIRIT